MSDMEGPRALRALGAGQHHLRGSFLALENAFCFDLAWRTKRTWGRVAGGRSELQV